MRILWLSYYYLPHVGGGTWSAYSLSRILASKGHEVQLVVPNVRFSLSISREAAQSTERKNPSKVNRTPGFPMPRTLGPLLAAFPMFFAGLRLGKKADVIVCQFHPHHFVMVVGVFLGRIFRIPVVVRACDISRSMGLKRLSLAEELVKVINTLNESLIRYTSAFLVATSDNLETLMLRIGRRCPPGKVRLTSNGFDASDFRDLPTKEEARKSLGIEPRKKVLLFVGRFSGKEYGAKVLLKAFSLLVKKEPDSLLYLVGDELPVALQPVLDSLGIGENARVCGSMPHEDVAEFIVASDVCIGPLMATQAMPLKVLEYMTCGKPVVTGKGSITVDLDPESNFILTLPEPENVSEAFLKALTNNDLVQALGSSSRKIAGRLTWERIAEDLERVLTNAIRDYD
jgi:glycosyltransferase involved in cell wall biosynthesis